MMTWLVMGSNHDSSDIKLAGPVLTNLSCLTWMILIRPSFRCMVPLYASAWGKSGSGGTDEVLEIDIAGLDREIEDDWKSSLSGLLRLRWIGSKRSMTGGDF